MNVGVLIRADASGLGTQSRWVARLLQPRAAVVVDMGHLSRGPTVEVEHPNLLTVPYGRDQSRQIAAHFSECDTVWTAEALYFTALPRRLARKRVCVHANPELYVPTRDRNIVPALPTAWRAEALGFPVVRHPSPVGDPVFAEVAAANRARGGPARRILHIAAPAMLDRNGTDALMAGLRLYDGPPFTLVVAGAGLDGRKQISLPRRVRDVTVERVAPVVENVDLYRDVDLLVLPRRYAGQCLPAAEAAAAGVPVLMSAVPPQDGWPGVDASIVCGRGQVHPMRGGRFTVHQPDPRSLAQRLLTYTSEPEVRARWQTEAMAWAWDNRWEMVEPEWRAWLDPSHR